MQGEGDRKASCRGEEESEWPRAHREGHEVAREHRQRRYAPRLRRACLISHPSCRRPTTHPRPQARGRCDPSLQIQSNGRTTRDVSQARRQYQFPTNKSNIPSSRLVVMMKSFMALCGWHIVRAMFCIVGGSHQFMHRDRGHYHSVSLFVCLVARRVRFGRRGGEDFEVFMNAGDVLAFNGLVWHSGLANDSDSCVVFMYFDREPFYITDEMRADKQLISLDLALPKCTARSNGLNILLHIQLTKTHIQLFSLRTWRCYQQASCAPLYQPLNSPLICKS